MQRRVWIRQVLVAGMGTMCLPALAREAGATEAALKHIRISNRDEALLALVTETIIPATDTPGAMALNLHQFVLKMMDDCYDAAARAKLLSGMKKLDAYAAAKGSAPFERLSPGQRLQVLRAIRDEKDTPEDLRYFLSEVRRLTVRGYENSEYFLTRLKPYELVPGRFDGCKKITA